MHKLVALLAALALWPSVALAQTPTNMQIFVAGGQSNMDGAAPMPSNPPTASRSYFFMKDYHWRAAYEPSHDATNAVDTIGFESGGGAYSALTSFASNLAGLETSWNIGVVPRAKGGTGLDQWACNPSDQSLYGAMLKAARAASTMGTLAGLLWWQGENEASGATAGASSWATNFTTIVNCFRHDVYRTNLPVIVTQIRQTSDPYNATVRAQQMSMSSVSKVAVWDANSLTYQTSSPLHADQAGYDLAGQKMAQAFESIIHPATPTPTPTPTHTPTPTSGPRLTINGSQFTWSGLVGPSDWTWFAVFANAGDSYTSYLSRTYLSPDSSGACSVSGAGASGVTPTNGTCTFIVPSTPGTYYARLVDYVSHATITQIAFTV